MRHLMVSVYDNATETYGRPAFVPARGAAVRSFTDEVNRHSQDNQLSNHPEDFELYFLGVFDDETGLAEPVSPELIVRGKDVARASQ